MNAFTSQHPKMYNNHFTFLKLHMLTKNLVLFFRFVEEREIRNAEMLDRKIQQRTLIKTSTNK